MGMEEMMKTLRRIGLPGEEIERIKAYYRNDFDGLKSNAYSYAAEPVPVDTHITYTSDTDFSRVIDGRKPEDVWPIIDEFMSTVQVLMPRLYAKVMRDLQ